MSLQLGAYITETHVDAYVTDWEHVEIYIFPYVTLPAMVKHRKIMTKLDFWLEWNKHC